MNIKELQVKLPNVSILSANRICENRVRRESQITNHKGLQVHKVGRSSPFFVSLVVGLAFVQNSAFSQNQNAFSISTQVQ